jgi:hypothetical protein
VSIDGFIAAGSGSVGVGVSESRAAGGVAARGLSSEQYSNPQYIGDRQCEQAMVNAVRDAVLKKIESTRSSASHLWSEDRVVEATVGAVRDAMRMLDRRQMPVPSQWTQSGDIEGGENRGYLCGATELPNRAPTPTMQPPLDIGLEPNGSEYDSAMSFMLDEQRCVALHIVV